VHDEEFRQMLKQDVPATTARGKWAGLRRMGSKPGFQTWIPNLDSKPGFQPGFQTWVPNGKHLESTRPM
jgi:hypothetical protein